MNEIILFIILTVIILCGPIIGSIVYWIEEHFGSDDFLHDDDYEHPIV